MMSEGFRLRKSTLKKLEKELQGQIWEWGIDQVNRSTESLATNKELTGQWGPHRKAVLINMSSTKAEREVTKLLTSINRAALNSHGLLPCYTVREEANRCSTVRGAPQYGEEWTVRSIGRVKRTNTSGSSAVQGCNSGGGVHSKLAGVCAVQQGERGRISADG